MDKQALYQQLVKQIEAFAGGNDHPVSILANCAAAMKCMFPKEFFWVGFYIVSGDNLFLGPFQGTPACTRIKFGRGVCGTAWAKRETVIVPDVELFPGHIACSSASRSEIVVPVFNESNTEVMAVLDIDSAELDTFDQTDKEWLEKIARLLYPIR